MRDRSRPILRPAAALALAVLTLPACSHRNVIAAGTYTAHSAPVAGAQLAIGADKREVTFTLPGGPPVKRSAAAWEASRWPTLCPRGLKDTASEVLDLGPEPLQLGAIRVEHPLVVANCLGAPAVGLHSLGSDGEPTKPGTAAFER
jgi:hypothetical protein